MPQMSIGTEKHGKKAFEGFTAMNLTKLSNHKNGLRN